MLRYSSCWRQTQNMPLIEQLFYSFSLTSTRTRTRTRAHIYFLSVRMCLFCVCSALICAPSQEIALVPSGIAALVSWRVANMLRAYIDVREE